MSNLLFEIGTEELPAGFIQPALEQLNNNFKNTAKALRIHHGSIYLCATPRRLALIVENLADKQGDVREELVGPSVKAGLDTEGQYTKAAVGFAKSKGAEPADLKIIETAKGEYLALTREVQGQQVSSLLPDLLGKLILDLSFAKSMRWGTNQLTFARPIQWLLALNDEEIVNFEHEGITSSNLSRGHRFLNNTEITIKSASTYAAQLEEVNVIVDVEKRKAAVLETVKSAVASSENLSEGEVFVDENLLNIVTNLVEIPVGICGTFNEKFLELPDDVLITSMREHQKYFPVVNGEGTLMAGFVAVNNTITDDQSITRKGHQRVLRARLEDALFFYNADKTRKLENLVPSLAGIIFQAKLGTMLEKNERIVKLSRLLAEKIDPGSVEDCCRAAKLCKTDLLTEMVGEFPSLQGVMGHAYALHEGESEKVALAIKEHYMPKRSGADIPSDVTGAIVGLADRLDTLTGCFGIGQIPSGTADPFGLRRLSLAILQLIQGFELNLSLREIVSKALALYGDRVDGSSATVDTILSFIEGRYKNDYIAKGFDAEAVAAAAAVGFDDIIDCRRRIEALSEIKEDVSFSVLASAYKRIRNIIKDNGSTTVEVSLLKEDAEVKLYEHLVEVSEKTLPLLKVKDYSGSIRELLKMKEPVDTFFDKVMVMDKDEKVRQNRLNLLTALGEIVLKIGDISKMHEA